MSLLPCACNTDRALHGWSSRIEFADDLTFVHNKDAVRNAQNFFEFEGDQKDGSACISLGDQLSVDVFDSAYVKSAGGLDGDQEFRFLSSSRAMTAFCWLLPDMERTMSTDLRRFGRRTVDQFLEKVLISGRFRKPAPLLKSGEKYLCRTVLRPRE